MDMFYRLDQQPLSFKPPKQFSKKHKQILNKLFYALPIDTSATFLCEHVCTVYYFSLLFNP